MHLYTHTEMSISIFKKSKRIKQEVFFYSLQLKIKKELNTIFFNTVKHIYLSPSGTDSEYLSSIRR